MHSRMWHRAFEAIQFGRTPVVTVLHGAVVGGGARARRLDPYPRRRAFGLLRPAGGPARHLPRRRRLGPDRAADRRSLRAGPDAHGRTLSAEEGHAAGITQYLVEDGRGLEKAFELAAKAASNTPTTNFAVLHALPRIAESEPVERAAHGIADGDDRRDEPRGDAAAEGFSGEARGQGAAAELSVCRAGLAPARRGRVLPPARLPHCL